MESYSYSRDAVRRKWREFTREKCVYVRIHPDPHSLSAHSLRGIINPGSKVHNGSSLPAALGMAGDGWGWLGEGRDGGDGSFVTEITYGKFINPPLTGASEGCWLHAAS